MRTVLRTLGYLRYNRLAAVLAAVSLAGNVGFSVLTPLILKRVIDFAIARHNYAALFLAALGVILLAVLPLIGLRAFRFSRRLRPLWLRVQTAQGAFTTVLQENIVGVRVVRAFTREREELAKFNKSNLVVRVDSLTANKIAAF